MDATIGSPPASPFLVPSRLRIEPTPSPPPDIIQQSQAINNGVAILISFLDGRRNPHIAREAGRNSLPDDENPLALATGLSPVAAEAPDISRLTDTVSIENEQPATRLLATSGDSINRVTSSPDGTKTRSTRPYSSASRHHDKARSNQHCARSWSSSSNAGETPNTDYPASTTTTFTSINSASVTGRMGVDGISHPRYISGSYTCTFPGCSAAPFQTQYLLKSHMNVHSSARPHYCPEKSCPRGKGGKGFKRKNELIRHGLVHESLAYVCPFCSDREHKYPRPDNLQRHVRDHHPDKDKDDPQLRDVIAQRPGGTNRPRRNRESQLSK